MSESAMWQELRPLLAGLDPTRVENVVNRGTPDVNYTRGWIELKYAKEWPKRGGPLVIKHFKPQQRAWLIRRRQAGGRAFVLLKVGESEWLLFEGAHAARRIGAMDCATMIMECLRSWPQKPTKEELQKWL